MADEQGPLKVDYFHLSGTMLSPGSIIQPGNYDRILRAYGWQHNSALREMALERARFLHFSDLPSRLDAAFVFLTRSEANFFQSTAQGFQQHLLYRVTLANPNASSHISDTRLCNPCGTLRHDWANIYWLPYEKQGASIIGIDWHAAIQGNLSREMLTLSSLRVEERLN